MRHCRKLQSERDIPLEVQNMISKMIEQLDRRFLNIEDNLNVAEPTILDPRFKKYAFSNNAAFENAKTALTNAASRVVLTADHTHVPEVVDDVIMDDNGCSSELEKNEKKSIWEEYDMVVSNVLENDNATAAGIIEMNRYIQEPIIKRNQNPLVWWKERQHTYPRLFQL